MERDLRRFTSRNLQILSDLQGFVSFWDQYRLHARPERSAVAVGTSARIDKFFKIRVTSAFGIGLVEQVSCKG